MTVIIDDFKIDSALFRNCCINETLRIVYLIHRPRGLEGEVMLHILFDKVSDTRRFYDEYHEALYDNEDIYEYSGNARFSKELYERISESTKLYAENERSSRSKRKTRIFR